MINWNSNRYNEKLRNQQQLKENRKGSTNLSEGTIIGPNVSLSSLKEVENDLQQSVKRKDSSINCVIDPPESWRDAMNIAIIWLFRI